MRTKTLASFLVIGHVTVSVSLQAISIDDIRLTAEEVAPHCRPIEKARPVRNDAQLFYDHGVDSDEMPLVFKKEFQAFACGPERGVLYYFEYVDPAYREKAERIARAMLWDGEDKPSPRHPEQIFHWDRFLMVLSFKTMQRELLTALLKKLKGLDPIASRERPVITPSPSVAASTTTVISSTQTYR